MAHAVFNVLKDVSRDKNVVSFYGFRYSPFLLPISRDYFGFYVAVLEIN